MVSASRSRKKGRPRRSAGRGRRAEFISRASQVLGVSKDAAERAFSSSRGASVRVNRLSPRSGEEIRADLARGGFELEPIRWCEDAYFLHSDKHQLGVSELVAGGDVYIQNPSSLLPSLALDPRRGESILDAAAAPGGKASHIAAIVGNECELWLNDPIEPRLRRLREVIGTYGVEPARITAFPGQYLDKMIEARFDRILLDAQCSGEGRVDLRRGDALAHWSPSRLESNSRLQQRMLVSAFKLLAPGGTLVYATCSLSPEENEAPVSHLLSHRDDARLEPIEIEVPQAIAPLRDWNGRRFHPELSRALRIAPDGLMEAFFVAKVVKAA